MPSVRYPIAISRPWRGFFALFGWSRERAYVELDAEALHIRFGPATAHIPRGEIAGVQRRTWPWIYGLGAKLGPSGGVSYVGRGGEVLQIDFVRPRPMLVWGPFRTSRARCVILSLEQPDHFLADLRGAGDNAAP